jgi:hypothetical protein
MMRDDPESFHGEISVTTTRHGRTRASAASMSLGRVLASGRESIGERLTVLNGSRALSKPLLDCRETAAEGPMRDRGNPWQGGAIGYPE